MPAQTWRKLLAALLFIPAVAAGAEVPRLIVSAPYQPQANTVGSAVVTASDGLMLTVVGTTDDGCNPDFLAPEVNPGRIVWRGASILTFAPCNDEPWLRQVHLDPLPAGTYQVSVTLDDHPYAALTLVVNPPSHQVMLFPGNGVFTVGLTFKDPVTGAPTPAAAVPLSFEGASFWFFDPNNLEATVKILDGRPVNGHFWVFLSSMTTLDLTVHVSWCPSVNGVPCTVKDYHSTPGKNLDVVDVTTFTGVAVP